MADPAPTDLATTLWALEKRFWLDGADFYEGTLAPDAVMVFPYPSGILDRDGAMAGLARAPHWQTIEMSEQSLQRRGDTAVLAYHARAWRAGHAREGGADMPWEALCASTYIRDGDTWLMLAHSQQPLGVAADPTRDA